VALFVQLNNIQVIQAGSLSNAPGNPRTILASRDNPRGTIVSAGGTVLAKSVPTPNDIYRYRREYPTGSLFAQVVGFDSYVYGMNGVEGYYNKYLTPYQAPISSIRDFLASRTSTDTLRLTLSDRLQALAAKELGNRTGSVVAIDPSTGAILAMYSSPSFNPNPLAYETATKEIAAWKSYIANPAQPMLDRAWRRSYPPGSTFKIVTTSAVYDQDPSLATKSFPVLTQTPLPGTSHQLHNYAYEACGGTMAQMLPPSCDTGYSLIGLALGPKKLISEADSFGFNKRPPLDVQPAPAVSTLATLSYLQQVPSFVAFSAIGQGDDQATALQMALVGSAVANHGTIMKPHVLYDVRSPSGKVVYSYKPSKWLQATSSSTASKVADLMTKVAQYGTAASIFPSSWQVAAKTGTSQIGLHGETTDWMVTFAPASHPRVAIAVVVPRQAPSATGASIAGPIQRAMLQGIFGSSHTTSSSSGSATLSSTVVSGRDRGSGSGAPRAFDGNPSGPASDALLRPLCRSSCTGFDGNPSGPASDMPAYYATRRTAG
jgi:peptidoglycan glycosyltransferase